MKLAEERRYDCVRWKQRKSLAPKELDNIVAIHSSPGLLDNVLESNRIPGRKTSRGPNQPFHLWASTPHQVHSQTAGIQQHVLSNTGQRTVLLEALRSLQNHRHGDPGQRLPQCNSCQLLLSRREEGQRQSVVKADLHTNTEEIWEATKLLSCQSPRRRGWRSFKHQELMEDCLLDLEGFKRKKRQEIPNNFSTPQWKWIVNFCC